MTDVECPKLDWTEIRTGVTDAEVIRFEASPDYNESSVIWVKELASPSVKPTEMRKGDITEYKSYDTGEDIFFKSDTAVDIWAFPLDIPVVAVLE